MSPRRRSPGARSSEQGEWPEARPRLPGPSAPRPAGRRAFGSTWWGRAWVDALENRARLDPNRLPRGRTYARSGAVGPLDLRPGEVLAKVQGSRRTPYSVRVRVRAFDDPEWERLLEALSSQIGHTAALLDGELPPGIAEDARSAGLDLLPGPGEVQPRCDCPDWADPCKHAAAVCYLVADVLDEDPFGVLLLRGRARDEVLASIRSRRSLHAGAAGMPGAPATPASSDPGLAAREVFARPVAGLPVPPLPPRVGGRPTVLGVDPPPGLGVDAARLRELAADAARRALDLALGASSTGLELTVEEDLARRAALAIPVAAPIGLSGPTAREPAAVLRGLASGAGVPARLLLRRALAWRDGGRDGLGALEEAWDPPVGDVAVGRELLGAAAAVRRNRVTLGDRQLRLGRDGRWYPFRRSSDRAWDPDGPPLEGMIDKTSADRDG